MDGPNNLEIYITLGWKGLPGTNTLAYWPLLSGIYIGDVYRWKRMRLRLAIAIAIVPFQFALDIVRQYICLSLVVCLSRKFNFWLLERTTLLYVLLLQKVLLSKPQFVFLIQNLAHMTRGLYSKAF